MPRDRDHKAIARRTRREGEALLQAWMRERESKAALDAIRRCPSVWGDLQCELLEGHDQRAHPTQHRHRMPGSSVVVTW